MQAIQPNTLEDYVRRLITNQHLVAIVALTFLWVVFFWRLYTPIPEDRVVFPQGDFSVQFHAYAQYQAERLLDGEIPLWNPYNNAGDPFASDPQSQAWYPPRWLSIWLSRPDGFTQADLQREVAAHYWLASFLMYLFLRVATKRSSSALIGSLLFAYGGYLTGYPMLQVSILYSGVWLPLILMGIHISTTITGWAVRGVLIGALGLGLSILGGHSQTNLHIGYIALAYLLFMSYNHHCSLKGIVARMGGLFLVGGLLGLVQLWPALEFSSLSVRLNEYTYIDKSSGFAIVDLLQVIWPRLLGMWSPLYVGVAGLLLGTGAMFRRSPNTIFWTATVIVSLFVSFGNNSIVYDIFYLFVPGMGVFRQQERLALGFSLAMATLAAYQINWLVNRPRLDEIDPTTTTNIAYRLRFEWSVYAHMALTILVAGLFIFSRTLNEQPLSDETTNTFMFVAFISMLFMLWQRWQRTYRDSRTIVLAVLMLLIMVDLFTIGTRSDNFLPDIPENRAQAPALLNVLSVPNYSDIRWHVDGLDGIQYHGTLFNIPDIYGTSPLYLETIGKLRDIPQDRYWEVLAVRYVMLIDPPPDTVNVELIGNGQNYDGDPYNIYELENPRPFAMLTYDAIASTGHDATRRVMSDEAIDLRETAVITGMLPITLAGQRPEDATIENMNFLSPEELRLDISTSENALLTVAMPYYPGWEAELDGEQIAIVDTYGGLIGVPIEGKATSQELRLVYRPKSIFWGAIISSVTLFSLLGVLLVAPLIRKLTS